MESQLSRMRALARRICDEEREKQDVGGVLLFGSVSKGNVHAKSDIDIVVIREGQNEPVKRSEYEKDGVKVDMWKHSPLLYETLFQKDWNCSKMFMLSITLNILQTCEILYDPEGRFKQYKKNSLEWSWPRECRDFVERKWKEGVNTVERIYDPFKKLATVRRLLMVKACKHLLGLGKPVSIRNKDYYQMLLDLGSEPFIEDLELVLGRAPKEKELEELVDRSLSLFYKEMPQRDPWTELSDAQKHLSNGDLFLAAISLQNGAYYIGSEGLANRGTRLETNCYLWPESESELIEKSKQIWPEFYHLYRRIHNVIAWRADEINDCFELVVSKNVS